MYEFRTLEDIEFDDLASTWNLAFSDYIVDMEMTPGRLEAYFKISGVDYRKSFGAFCGDELVGMLMNSIDSFKGKTVAYDAMTGIVPEHRGKGLFSELFEYTRNSLKGEGITHYYLEVIQTNERAYYIYSSKGCNVEREFSFFKGKSNRSLICNSEIEVLPLADYPAEEICLYEPSFSNRVSAMLRNADDYQVASLEIANSKSAAVFNTQGRVTQIQYRGAEDKTALIGIMAYISQKFKELEISNIPVTETGLIKDLLNIGFKIIVDQYEMSFEL